MLIEASHLYRFYGNTCAVADLSLTLEKGEILGFLGPNGAGKSTTMQMLCGTLAPSAGEIRINGIDLLDRPKEAKHHLGYLPELPPLYRELTVDEYLNYCGRLHGLRGAALIRARDEAKARCGLAEVGGRLIGNLSKGYQQRVGIAQAILHSPPVVVLDEPTVGLDPIQIREIRSLIRDLGREHAVLLSTHILPEVQAVCSRVMIVHQGKVALNAPIDELERHMRASSLVLVTEAPADPAALQAVEGVHDVRPLEGGHRYEVFHDKDRNPAPALAALVVEKGWGLLELTPVRHSIEEIFVDITRQEAA
ncbi:ABC-2 type transport system ATP-binding protein [Methylomarinovum tepidoasis]|uniref:ABC-2 type transport system ATP-binding protein n=1 Tax=Methylomarinovum tepidoasis TaxID=2840183 RepID=A0AAU9CT81_9GAMM|nr:ATP-binding cassette domain-containing protein [Methylomarinovum sp. IN45]BCX87805.1 ABC-2 type transport system ATP-binding protein [Methylomarinovum sp. IN45]